MNVSTGIVYPLEYLSLIKDVSSLAELKVISCILGYDAIVGIETEPMTFTDIKDRSGLSKRSTQAGIKKAISRQIVAPKEIDGVRYFMPNTKSIPHEHVHGNNIVVTYDKNITTKDHEHGENFVRQNILQILIDDFGMEISRRVAEDIALSPKYAVERLETQIRYTRWEMKYGLDSGSSLTNPPGRLVFRIRNNRPAPKDFKLKSSFIDVEGYTEEELYQAIFNGDFSLPEIEDSFDYEVWRSTKLRFADEEFN